MAEFLILGTVRISVRTGLMAEERGICRDGVLQCQRAVTRMMTWRLTRREDSHTGSHTQGCIQAYRGRGGLKQEVLVPPLLLPQLTLHPGLSFPLRLGDYDFEDLSLLSETMIPQPHINPNLRKKIDMVLPVL